MMILRDKGNISKVLFHFKNFLVKKVKYLTQQAQLQSQIEFFLYNTF